ncbi:MAG: secretin N-terminal domain-containing protein [Limisphaerales bacterium]
MQSNRPTLKFKFIAALLSLCLAALVLWFTLPFVHAQNAQPATPSAAPPTPSSANPPAPAPAAATNSPAASTNSPAGSTNSPTGSTNAAPESAAAEVKKLPTDLIELTFQNAPIDQVIQWLSENTGKSVVKHPSAHCQITIVGVKKVTREEAVTLIYRALAMEGFTAIESSKSILIVPDDKEPKLSPEYLSASQTEVPGGRQRLFRVFTLQHVQAADLSEKIKSVLSEKATIVTDDRANLMVVTDYNDNLAAAAALVTALDVEKNDDVTVRVIPLKNVSAQELAKQVQPLYQKLTGKQSKEIIEVSASQSANSLMVLSSGASFREIEKFAVSLDTSDAQEKVMKTFELKNADAQDVARQLQDLGKEQGNNSPFRIFYFGGNPNQDDSKKMGIVADRRRNAILVQAPPAAMQEIAKVIASLDEPVNDNALAPQIIPLRYVSAGDIEDVLNELFLRKSTQRPYYYYFDEAPEETADRDVGRLYGKVRITSEPASNALIIAANSQENLDAVIEVVKKLDRPSEAGDTTFHIKLNFGNAAKIANRINILFAKGGSPALRAPNQPNQNNGNPTPQQPSTTQGSTPTDDFNLEQVVKEDPYYSWLGGQPDNPRGGYSSGRAGDRPASDLVGRVRVVPNELSNSLLVTANMHLFTQVSRMIEEMDVPPAEVLIDAKLLQVSANYLDNMGVRYSPNGSQVFSGSDYQNSLMPQLGGSYQKGVGGPTTVNTPSNPGGSGAVASVAQVMTSLRSGVLTGNMSMDFLIQFLQQKTDATVISEPQITISDNDMAKLFVGQQVPIITGSQQPAVGGLQENFTYRNVGVILEVEPHINQTGDVSLRVRAESSTIDPTQTIQGQVVIDTAQFRTELTAKAGQTLVLGGIIQKQITKSTYKTPVIGSIPGLNYLFGKKDKSGNRVELLVFLRPKVVRTPDEARALLEETRKHTPLIDKWEETHSEDKLEKSNPEVIPQ